MARYGSPSVVITLDDSAGSPVIVTNYILEIGSVKVTANTEPSTAFGDSWEENLPTAIRKVEELTLTGFLDDAVQHPAMKDPDSNPNGTSRTLVVDFGGGAGTNTILTVECWLTSYEIQGTVNGLSRFTATILPTGSAAWS
jgi:hypothetical protein